MYQVIVFFLDVAIIGLIFTIDGNAEIDEGECRVHLQLLAMLEVFPHNVLKLVEESKKFLINIAKL